MPKLKTNRSAAKRIRRTGTGKLKRSHTMHSHILTKKPSKRRRRLRKSTLVDSRNVRRMKVLLPN